MPLNIERGAARSPPARYLAALRFPNPFAKLPHCPSSPARTNCYPSCPRAVPIPQPRLRQSRLSMRTQVVVCDPLERPLRPANSRRDRSNSGPPIFVGGRYDPRPESPNLPRGAACPCEAVFPPCHAFASPTSPVETHFCDCHSADESGVRADGLPRCQISGRRGSHASGIARHAAEWWLRCAQADRSRLAGCNPMVVTSAGQRQTNRVDSQDRKGPRREAKTLPSFGTEFRDVADSNPSSATTIHLASILGLILAPPNALISGLAWLVPELTRFETGRRVSKLGFYHRGGSLLPRK